jgi:hypothetical protein
MMYNLKIVSTGEGCGSSCLLVCETVKEIKMKKKLFRGIGWVIVLGTLLVLAACTPSIDEPIFEESPVNETAESSAQETAESSTQETAESPDVAAAESPNDETESALTPHDYLALLKTQETHKVSVDDLQKMAAGLLEKPPHGRSVSSAENVVRGIKKLPISNSRNFIGFAGPGRSAEAVPETEPVEIYELSVGQPDTESEGFILASNDIRIGAILAIAEGSLEDANEEFLEVLNANLQDYIDATIAEYNAKCQVAVLMYHLGAPFITTSDYYPYYTTTFTDQIITGFARLGYTGSAYHNNTSGVIESSNGFQLYYNISLDTIRNALNSNKPILIFGAPAANQDGHYWVIDGHGSMTSYCEYFYKYPNRTNHLGKLEYL